MSPKCCARRVYISPAVVAANPNGLAAIAENQVKPYLAHWYPGRQVKRTRISLSPCRTKPGAVIAVVRCYFGNAAQEAARHVK